MSADPFQKLSSDPRCELQRSNQLFGLLGWALKARELAVKSESFRLVEAFVSCLAFSIFGVVAGVGLACLSYLVQAEGSMRVPVTLLVFVATTLGFTLFGIVFAWRVYHSRANRSS